MLAEREIGETDVSVDYDFDGKGRYCLKVSSQSVDGTRIEAYFPATSGPKDILTGARQFLQWWQDEADPSIEREVSMSHCRRIIEFAEKQLKRP